MPDPASVAGGSVSPRPPGLPLPRMMTLTDQTDEAGRLLLEDSAPKRAQKEAHRAGIAMKTTRCQYPDSPSRVGGLMNVSAYEALRHDIAAVLDGFSWLAERYLETNPTEARGSLPVLLNTSNLAITLPTVLFQRAHDPVPAHRSLPTAVASIFKAGRGIFSASVGMLNDGSFSGDLSVRQVMDYAEREGHFARPDTGRVCAAPTRLIERAVDAIVTGTGTDPSRSILAGVVEFPTLWDFYRLQDSFNQACSHYRFVLGSLTGGNVRADPTAFYGERVTVNGKTGSFEALTQALLYEANVVEAELNRILGRADTPAPVTLGDLMRLL